MYAPAAQGQHRRDVRTQRVADHGELVRRAAALGNHPGVGRRILFRNDLDAGEQVGQARGRDLGLLVEQVALGDEDDVMHGRHGFHRAADIGQEFHRMPEHLFAQVQDARQIRGTDARIGHRHGRLEHRQRHALGPVAEQQDVGLFGGQQAIVQGAVGQIEVGREDALELGVRGAKVDFAVPEGVVGVEAHEGDGARRRALPGLGRHRCGHRNRGDHRKRGLGR